MCSKIALSKYYQVHSGKLLTKQQLRSISFIKLLRGKLHYSNTKNCYKAKIYLWNWEHEFETIGEHLNWFDLQRLNFMLDFIIMDYFSMHNIKIWKTNKFSPFKSFTCVVSTIDDCSYWQGQGDPKLSSGRTSSSWSNN